MRLVKPMNTADIFWWCFLGLLALVIVCATSYYLWQLIKGFWQRRGETDEERKQREWLELQRSVERDKRIERMQKRISGGLFFGVGILGVLVGIGIFLYQCYFWLKYGTWLRIPFWELLTSLDENILDDIQISWKGIERVVFWILNLSAALVSCIIGVLSYIIGLKMHFED
jgi:hypothetical protein